MGTIFYDDRGIKWKVSPNKKAGLSSAAAKIGANKRSPGIWFSSEKGQVRHISMDPVAIPHRAALRNMGDEKLKSFLKSAKIVKGQKHKK